MTVGVNCLRSVQLRSFIISDIRVNTLQESYVVCETMNCPMDEEKIEEATGEAGSLVIKSKIKVGPDVTIPRDLAMGVRAVGFSDCRPRSQSWSALNETPCSQGCFLRKSGTPTKCGKNACVSTVECTKECRVDK